MGPDIAFRQSSFPFFPLARPRAFMENHLVSEPNVDRAEIIGMTSTQLKDWMAALGEAPYRARQLHQWLFKHRAPSFDAMTELPRTLKKILEERASIVSARIENIFISSDGTRRYLLGLADGCEIEAVFMPEETRDTICISSQVGCPLACDFCMTGVVGLKRNMTAAEIISQVIIVLNDVYGAGNPTPHRTNIVMMGMGEPLLNYDNVMQAIQILADEDGLAIALRYITLSTAGIVPGIDALAMEPRRPRLAISLTAATDELRDRLFPINRKYNLDSLIAACRRFPLGPRERLTFEYVMLDGVNDSDRDAKLLVRLLSSVKAKVNLIPHNAAPELPYRSSPMQRIMEFQKVLTDAKLPSFIRRPRGLDISAACGQLAARHSATE